MGKMRDIFTSLHKATQRDCLGRMMDSKVECMEIAKKFDKDFWDGDRRYGYGGYAYDGRQKAIADALISTYNLKENASILDIGCGKGFLLYELKKLLPKARIVGLDISTYAITHAKEEVKENLFVYDAKDPLPFGDGEFDLVLSLGTLHNLPIFHLKTALQEMQRVGKEKFVMVEGYRNNQELFNLECWALTCESFFRPDEWIWLFGEFGYSGDYEFIYF